MLITDAQIGRMVSSPSLGAVTYQACALLQDLKRISDEEYPPEAYRIRNVLLSLAEHLLEELWALYDPNDPQGARELEGGFDRMRVLGEAVQEIYSYLRYLRASFPTQTPPAIQVTITQLTDLYFPEANGLPICLVRPQWKYNLTCIHLTWFLRRIVVFSVLDPDAEFDDDDTVAADTALKAIWDKWLSRLSGTDRGQVPDAEFPKQLAILSFAGLDTHDALLYPLLAHELAHFIDFSHTTPLSLQDRIASASTISTDEVREAIERTVGHPVPSSDVASHRTRLLYRVSVCIRELLADTLATRMMGFSFFAAQAEFLKTVSLWPEPDMTPSGYPGVRFRLKAVFDHLVDSASETNLEAFLRSHSSRYPLETSRLLRYLAEWRTKLTESTLPPIDGTQITLEHALDQLVKSAVERALPVIRVIAAEMIPENKRAGLSEDFFHRIDLLQADLPPIRSAEDQNCFAEIMSSSWAYQILFGEIREINETTVGAQFNEYSKVCRLILKAIELIPIAQGQVPVESTTSDSTSQQATKHGVLGAADIRHRVTARGLAADSRLAVVPYDSNLVKGSSLDVRLGNWFAVARKTKLEAIHLRKDSQEEYLMQLMNLGMEEAFVPPNKTFVIHPGDLVLGATLEFMALPNDIMAFVEGRSTLGRLGLIVATATQVAPGFHGVIILELANAGTIPLTVQPGMEIAQLVFQIISEPVPNEPYRGKYHCQIKPVLRRWPPSWDAFLPRAVADSSHTTSGVSVSHSNNQGITVPLTQQ